MIIATWKGMAISDNRRLIHLWGNRWGSDPKYKSFKEEMAWKIRSGVIPYAIEKLYNSRVSVRLSVSLPSRMDVSAIIKAALDAIQLSGLVRDDNQVDLLEVRRVGVSKRGESAIKFEIGGMNE